MSNTELTREHFNSNLTSSDIVNLFGQATLDRLERENCDYTSRVSADLDCNNEVEFSATISVRADLSHMGYGDMDTVSITAYYYQDKDAAATTDDLGSLDWEIRHIRIA